MASLTGSVKASRTVWREVNLVGGKSATRLPPGVNGSLVKGMG